MNRQHAQRRLSPKQLLTSAIDALAEPAFAAGFKTSDRRPAWHAVPIPQDPIVVSVLFQAAKTPLAFGPRQAPAASAAGLLR